MDFLIHATVDIGQMVEWISQQLQLEAGENGCLAVLHNRNDMACALYSSDWVVNSKGKVISRRVTQRLSLPANTYHVDERPGSKEELQSNPGKCASSF